ncbi:hypothetical protein F4780DRAFT_332730 [Xylariomycetidae sp. FL0641]|nr:hypothetical protein F4780DRAFT_332730 [Xylariomycetidae sp. FL0641]
MSTFSYAQAAKGHSATPSVSAKAGSAQGQSASASDPQNKDTPAVTADAPSVAPSVASNDLDSPGSPSVKPESAQHTNTDSNDTKSTNGDVGTPHSTTESVTSSRHGEKPSSEAVSQSAERRGHGPTADSEAGESSDNKKSKKTKKAKSDKGSESDLEQDKKEDAPPKVELSEAPIPKFNVWAQRQEAHAAKAKATPTVAPQLRSTPNVPSGSPATSVDAKQKQSVTDDETTRHNRTMSNGAKSFKREGDQSRNSSHSTPRRTAPRGVRGQERENQPTFEALNSLATETSAWPTPETAAVESKNPVQGDKSEKDDKEENAAPKPRQKEKWLPIQINHSVKFETALPGRSGARGGRTGGARGGRDMNAGGGHNAVASMDRTQEANAAPRTSSAGKRSSVDVSTARDTRKSAAQSEASRTARDIIQENGKDVSKSTQADVGEGQPGSARPSGFTQRPGDNAKAADFQRDGRLPNGRDSSTQLPNGHGRGDRPRGGGRNRGGYSNAGNANSVPHHAQQSAYAPGAGAYHYQPNTGARQGQHFYPSGYPPMAYGGPYQAQATPGHVRRHGSMGGRSQQGSRHTNQRLNSMPLNMPYDAGMFSPTNGVVPYVEAHSMLQLVQTQMEYYFSIDNLCKDMYLRQQMDSQGFVPLHIVTQFNRLRYLNLEYELFRNACEVSAVVDIVQGEDGVDRVRRREEWERFVLDMEHRDPSARHHGPSNFHRLNRDAAPHYGSHIMASPYGVHSHAPFSPTVVDPNYAPFGQVAPMPPQMNGVMNNGMDGYVRSADSQLTAAAPAFSPSTAGPGAHTGFPVENAQGPKTSTPARHNEPSANSETKPLPNGTHAAPDALPADIPATNGVTVSHKSEGH